MAATTTIDVPPATRVVGLQPMSVPWEPSIEFDGSRHWARRIFVVLLLAALGGAAAWFVKNKLDSGAVAERKHYAEDMGHFAGPQPDPEVVEEAEAVDAIDAEGRVKA
jgi:hypothetical protein